VSGEVSGGPAAILAAEEERLLACVHCGFCLSACPTYTRLGDEADSPRGRLHLMRAVAEGRLDPGATSFTTHIDRCLGCRACETACPSGVEYGHLLERAREATAAAAGLNLPTRLLLRIFGSRVLAWPALAGGRLLRAAGVVPLLLRLLPRRLGRIRFGVAMLGATTPWRGLSRVPTGGGAPAGLPERVPPLRVAFLTGCVQDGLFRRVNDATARVLRANGCEVVAVPGQRCCGALHAHGGAREAARELARANIAAFEAAGVDRIVVNAAGCGAAMKEYGTELQDDVAWGERARAFSGRVRDLFEFLAELGPRPGARLALRVTYDAPCHLHHGQRITRAPLEVLAAVTGVELVPLPGAEECCGGAGIYGLLHPELGGRIIGEKVAAIRGTGADVVVTPNPGCMMQIGAGLLLEGAEIPVLHPVELLDESYRRG
jgi:glycolate oxidase iron-sulfur subunit